MLFCLPTVVDSWQNLDLLEPHNLVPSGVYTIDGMLKYGEEHKQCPYFSVRRMVCNTTVMAFSFF